MAYDRFAANGQLRRAFTQDHLHRVRIDAAAAEQAVRHGYFGATIPVQVRESDVFCEETAGHIEARAIAAIADRPFLLPCSGSGPLVEMRREIDLFDPTGMRFGRGGAGFPDQHEDVFSVTVADAPGAGKLAVDRYCVAGQVAGVHGMRLADACISSGIGARIAARGVAAQG
ncbi:hypothetical protein EWM63_25500 [Pseudoduganella lutea]|uniref:Uncharacterized protein n=1 Tax=Pseudoduganella lutea TaxID=321985 RepID=A0A4P6L3R8_9BURK|nr:hypothetical protein [Pseudoduganella lutea]QBE65925.1 hypothetical protein EWM63_25500 [Pseudoduganella lutea]